MKGRPYTPLTTIPRGKGRPYANLERIPRPKKRKPKPLGLRDSPNRDRLVKPVGKKSPSKVLSPKGGKGRPNAGRRAPGRQTPGPPPVDPITGQVNSLLDLKYGEEQQSLEHEQSVSRQQHVNTDAYYQNYLNDLEKASQITTMAYGQGQQGVYGQSNLAAGQDQARMAQNQQQAQASAAIRGTSAAPQTEQAGAIGARQAQGGAFGGLLAAHGGAAATLNAGRYSAAGAARVGAHQQEQAREIEARQEARKLIAARSAEQVTVRQELEDDAFKRRLLAKEFGLDVRKQKGEEREDKRAARQKKRELRLKRLDTKADNRRLTVAERRQRNALRETQRANREREAGDRREEAGRNARDNGPSGYQQDYSQAVATLKSAYTYQNGKFTIKDKGKTYTYTLDEMATIIVRDMDIPNEIAKAAVFRVARRPVPKALVRRLRQFELKVPRAKPRPKYEGTPIQRLF